MAYATITKPSLHFNTKLYEGNGSSPRSITGVGFQPDWTWTKNRDNTNGHGLFDAVRGYTTGKGLSTHNANAQGNADAYGYLSSRDSDGYTMTAGGSGMTMNNTNGESYVSWNWKANGAGSSNSDGDVTSTVSVNSTAGISIVKWTNSGNAGWVGHGLGTIPHWILIKNLGSGSSITAWVNYHHKIDSSSPEDYTIYTNSTDARSDNPVFNDTAPTSTKFRFDSGDTTDYIAYCFAEKKGYSKFGSYTGNGNADGTFVYTGFKPAFLIIKRTDIAKNWYMHDIKRDGYNNDNPYLSPNLNAAETGGTELDLYSNGFKMRSNGTGHNQSGGTYIYMAFAEEPLVANVGNSIPATAR